HEGAVAAVYFDGIQTAPTLVASAGQLAAFQNSTGAILEFGDDRDPVLQITRGALALVMDNFCVRNQASHRADQEMGEINAMREHVPQLARAGELFDLAPAQVARAPVLKPAGPIMIGLAE